MPKEVRKALIGGTIVTAVLAILIFAGSRGLSDFDPALAAYAGAVLFAAFSVAYRFTIWLQRPPTARIWQRGWQTFFARGQFWKNLLRWLGRVADDFLAHRFIFRRKPLRGMAHLLILWGAIIAIAITFPLVFGWLHFETVPEDVTLYQAYIFGFPTFTFPTESLFAFFLFHGLVLSAVLLLGGTMLALRRRMRDEEAAVLQQFTEDFLPLILLFSIAFTGLMLTASHMWLRGFAYSFIAITHAITVIGTFLYLAFGKLFHMFQRPLLLGTRTYQRAGEAGEAAHCRRCGAPFTSVMHAEDLIAVEKALGYDYAMPGSPVEHYQWICPPCRRALYTLAQGAIWRESRGGISEAPPGYAPATPRYANPAIGEGPAGYEDAANFHA